MNSTNSDTLLNVLILDGKGLTLYDLGKFEEAIIYFDKILAMNSSEIEAVTDALNNKGLALNALGRHEEAISNYDRVLSILPNVTSRG
jgi:tetratricopeptide (TPR) repeat protein